MIGVDVCTREPEGSTILLTEGGVEAGKKVGKGGVGGVGRVSYCEW